mmetsp:Transcript_15531/g.33873  ORF Transcript_15531/g.33873 Transcript_15531/m.33873 type:complete len:207 (+) Transcript_15531:223-843(+)
MLITSSSTRFWSDLFFGVRSVIAKITPAHVSLTVSLVSFAAEAWIGFDFPDSSPPTGEDRMLTSNPAIAARGFPSPSFLKLDTPSITRQNPSTHSAKSEMYSCTNSATSSSSSSSSTYSPPSSSPLSIHSSSTGSPASGASSAPIFHFAASSSIRCRLLLSISAISSGVLGLILFAALCSALRRSRSRRLPSLEPSLAVNVCCGGF